MQRLYDFVNNQTHKTSLALPAYVRLSGSLHIVHTADRRGDRRIVEEFRIVFRFPGDLDHGVAKCVKGLHTFGLVGLNHQGFGHNQWEVDRGRVKTKIN